MSSPRRSRFVVRLPRAGRPVDRPGRARRAAQALAAGRSPIPGGPQAVRDHLVLLSAGPDRLLSGLCLVAPGPGLPAATEQQAGRPDRRPGSAPRPDEEARSVDQEDPADGLRPVLRCRCLGILPPGGRGSGWSRYEGDGSPRIRHWWRMHDPSGFASTHDPFLRLPSGARAACACSTCHDPGRGNPAPDLHPTPSGAGRPWPGRDKFDDPGFQQVLDLRSRRRISMSLLKWALMFLVFAGIAALLGFGGLASGFEDIAKVLFFVFLVVFAVIGMLSMTLFRTSPERSKVCGDARGPSDRGELPNGEASTRPHPDVPSRAVQRRRDDPTQSDARGWIAPQPLLGIRRSRNLEVERRRGARNPRATCFAKREWRYPVSQGIARTASEHWVYPKTGRNVPNIPGRRRMGC